MINLTLHGIGESPWELDTEEKKVWISPDELDTTLDEISKSDIFRLTVDDSNYSDIQFVLPALLKRNLTATFFITAGKLGQHGYIGHEDVETLAQTGMEIGTHGMYHRDWRKLDDAELSIEIYRSKDILKDIIGRKIDKAACPFGSYDRRILCELRNAGYRKVYTSDGGQSQNNCWIQPRNSLYATNDTQSLSQIIAQSVSIRNSFVRGIKKTIKRWR